MGYDMYWKDRAEEGSYFRLNMWEMGVYADAMDQLGVLADGYTMDDAPKWPDYPDGYFEWKYEEEGVEFTPEQIAAFQKVTEQTDARCSWSPAGVLGIPAHKFGTNDGWLVTPDECRWVSSKLSTAKPDDITAALEKAGVNDREYWDSWVKWIGDAADHGGFEVH